MFDSLADQMRHDEHEQYTTGERIIQWSAVFLISVLLFGALYLAVNLLH
jgi:hypothetical protein